MNTEYFLFYDWWTLMRPWLLSREEIILFWGTKYDVYCQMLLIVSSLRPNYITNVMKISWSSSCLVQCLISKTEKTATAICKTVLEIKVFLVFRGFRVTFTILRFMKLKSAFYKPCRPRMHTWFYGEQMCSAMTVWLILICMMQIRCYPTSFLIVSEITENLPCFFI